MQEEHEPDALAQDAEPRGDGASPVRGQGTNPWATLVIGLIIGFAVGYAIRSFATPGATLSSPGPTPKAVTSTTTGTPDATEDDAAPPSLSETVLAQVRHFKGDPNAPVTMVEFGDFQ